MRLRESVAGEVGHQVEDLGRLRLTHAAADRALDELGAHLRHLFLFLLAHRAAEDVGFAQAEAGQLAGDVHHLLLVHDDAVGLFQDRLELGQRVDDLLLAVLALHVLIQQAALERPRPEKGNRRRDVIEAGGAHVLDQPAQAGRLQLEHAIRIGGLQQAERRRVVPGDGRQVEFQAARLLQVLERVLDDRQVAQAEEVHLQEADLLHGVHLVLGHDRALLLAVLFAARDAQLQRHVLLQRLGGDHDAGGMGGRVPDQALEFAGVLQQPLVDGILLRLGQLRNHLHRLVERHVQLRRHQLGQVIDVPERHVERPADVADDGARLHRAEGDDLGHVVLAITLADVVDDTVTVAVVEVDVDVGHRDPLPVEKSLEDQAVLQRVERRDAERVADDAARCRPPTRPDGHAVATGVTDEVADDQEIGSVAHLLDHGHLRLEAIHDDLSQLRVADFQTLLGQSAKVGLGRLPRRHLEARQQRPGIELKGAALRDPHRVRHRLREVPEALGHFGRGLEIELVVVEAHALLIRRHRAGLQAEQDVVRLRIVLAGVVRVVGRDQRDPGALRDASQALVDPRLLLHPVVLDLEEVVVTEHPLILEGRLFGAGFVGVEQPAGHLAAQAAGERDQTLGMLGEQRLIDARLVVIPLEVRQAGELDEVAVAG